MLPEILKYYIGEYGRWTLMKASELREEGIPLNAICGDLGLPDDSTILEDCIRAGSIIRDADTTGAELR